ncbi:hypothetical protein EJ08DRAFT_689437 [Tothia fuscella]|uniref:Uncharacterized protein n=1 Tax=Tothia fuscella TaxID=1048955 RepID=A0A9P4TVR1_9PEZI|nr:hypothetical protein EJ08DRAFT_689437 [Tothia fuscella]
MGNPKAPPPAYRDEPLADAVSLHTTQGDDDYQDDAPETSAAPPAYSDNDGIQTATQVGVNPYVIAPLKTCNGVNIIMDPRFDSDPLYAEEAVRKWARIRPAQMIQIKGTHTQTVKNGNKQEKNTITDFDIKLRLTEYLINGTGANPWAHMETVSNNDKAHRGTVFKSRVKMPKGGAADLLEAGKPELNEWCHLFRVRRTVSGLDRKYLQEQIKALVNNTNYRGHTCISFPIENEAVEVYSTNRINTWRNTTWICMIFYITFLWLFTWPYLFFAEKRWSVVKVDWPFSVKNEFDMNCYTSISEQQLFQRWAKALETAILGKKQGTLVEEDLHRVDEPTAAFQSGHSDVDRAVSFIGAGIRGYNEVNRQLGWGGDC